MIARQLVPLLLVLASLASASGAGVTVSGRVTGLDGNDHVVVKLEGQRTLRATTRWAGLWQVDGVEPGIYSVTPYHERYTFKPSTLTITVDDRALVEVSFTARKRNQPESENRK